MILRPKPPRNRRNHGVSQRAPGHGVGENQGLPSTHASKDRESAASPPDHRHVSQPFLSVDNASSHHIPPVLPDRLITMAKISFPNTPIFQEAFRSADAMDESELPPYELDPPYMPPSYPTDTKREQDYTDKMVEVLHKRLMRERQTFEDHRMRSLSREGLRREREQEFVTLLGKWKEGFEYLPGRVPGWTKGDENGIASSAVEGISCL
jgi:hypothetical protein